MKQKKLSLNIHKILKTNLKSNYIGDGNIEDGGIFGGVQTTTELINLVKNNCYAIIMSCGDDDQYFSWVKYVCFDENEALTFIQNYNVKLRRVKLLAKELMTKKPNTQRYIVILNRNDAVISKLDLL